MSSNDNNTQVLDKTEATLVANTAKRLLADEWINNMMAGQQDTFLTGDQAVRLKAKGQICQDSIKIPPHQFLQGSLVSHLGAHQQWTTTTTFFTGVCNPIHCSPVWQLDLRVSYDQGTQPEGTSRIPWAPTPSEVKFQPSGIGVGVTSSYSTVMYSEEAIKSLVPKLKKDNLESYIIWNRKFTANLVFKNLAHVINANYMLQALPPNCSDTI